MRKPLDFSCKHDIMIMSDDGTLTPMDVPYFRERLIAPGTWRIESDGDYSFLLEGEDRAICIDTGYGCGDIRAFCQSLTKKPLNEVLSSHDHFDHTANNYLFDNCYMTEATARKATIPFNSFSGIDFPRDYKKTIIKQGDVIDLGGRKIEILEIHGHAEGGTVFLDHRERILFSGDEIGPSRDARWETVETYASQLRTVLEHKGEFDCIWAAYGKDAFPVSLLEDMLACCEDILAGEPGRPYEGKRKRGPVEDPEGLGRTIFMRRRPRYGDGSSLAQDNSTMRLHTHGSFTLGFDSARIYN